MSFNYLEVEHAVEQISAFLPIEVKEVQLLETPMPGPLADLNLGFKLASGQMLVFSLKAPWVGVLLTEPSFWRPAKQAWSQAFGAAPDLNGMLKNQVLEAIEGELGDRVVHLRFHQGARLTVELFPARPNWMIDSAAAASPGKLQAWRARAPARLRGEGQAPAFARAGAEHQELAVRDFSGQPAAPWFSAAYLHYLILRQTALLQSEKQRGIAQLQTRVAQLAKIRVQMDRQLAESAKAEELRASGSALKAVLHEYPPRFRAQKIEVPDYSSGTERSLVIDLDAKLGLPENVERMFARYKKLKRTQIEVQQRLIGIEAQSKVLVPIIGRARDFERGSGEPFHATYARLKALFKEAGINLGAADEKPSQIKKTERKWRDSGLRRFESREGFPLWVGRDHEENEELVIRMARGNDLWMHLKGRPGAHLIVRSCLRTSPLALKPCSTGPTLVAHYSGVADADKVEVDYTLRKHVKRVSGPSNDKFLVTYSQNKTLMVKIDADRLKRLLQQA